MSMHSATNRLWNAKMTKYNYYYRLVLTRQPQTSGLTDVRTQKHLQASVDKSDGFWVDLSTSVWVFNFLIPTCLPGLILFIAALSERYTFYFYLSR